MKAFLDSCFSAFPYQQFNITTTNQEYFADTMLLFIPHCYWLKKGAYYQIASDGKVELGDPCIQFAGEVAYERGFERGQAKFGGRQVLIDQRVTNICRLEPEGWVIVHRHVDLSKGNAKYNQQVSDKGIERI